MDEKITDKQIAKMLALFRLSIFQDQRDMRLALKSCITKKDASYIINLLDRGITETGVKVLKSKGVPIEMKKSSFMINGEQKTILQITLE